MSYLPVYCQTGNDEIYVKRVLLSVQEYRDLLIDLFYYRQPVSNWCHQMHYVDGLVQEKRNSIANALELRLSDTYPLMLCYAILISQWLQMAWC